MAKRRSAAWPRARPSSCGLPQAWRAMARLRCATSHRSVVGRAKRAGWLPRDCWPGSDERRKTAMEPCGRIDRCPALGP
eukprot:7558156-Lingulodinium_polyedra.AAC.1